MFRESLLDNTPPAKRRRGATPGAPTIGAAEASNGYDDTSLPEASLKELQTLKQATHRASSRPAVTSSAQDVPGSPATTIAGAYTASTSGGDIARRPGSQSPTLVTSRLTSRCHEGSAAKTPGHSSASSQPSSATSPHAAQPLSGLHLCLHSSIPHLKGRVNALQRRLHELGAQVTIDPAVAGPAAAVAGPATAAGTAAAKYSTCGDAWTHGGQVTHVVVGPGTASNAAKARELADQVQERVSTSAASASTSASTSSTTSAGSRTSSSAASGARSASRPAKRAAVGAGNSPLAQTPSSSKRGSRQPQMKPYPTPAAAAARNLREVQLVATELAIPPAQTARAPWSAQLPQPVAAAATPKIVESTWLDKMLSSGKREPSGEFLVGTATSGAATALDATAEPRGPFARYAAWMGYWDAKFDAMTKVVEFVLHNRYSEDHCKDIGNYQVAKVLKEMSKYEEALGGSKGDPGAVDVNHQALNYAHAHAMVLACAFRLTSHLSPGRLQQMLPFVGASTAKIINQVIATGTCEQLQCYESNAPVRDSRGELRPETEGGRSKRMFVRLPGMGHATARRLYNAGGRTYEDLDAMLGVQPQPLTLPTAAARLVPQQEQQQQEAASLQERRAAAAAAAAAVVEEDDPQFQDLDRSDEGQDDRARASHRARVDSGHAHGMSDTISREVTHSLTWRHHLLEDVTQQDMQDMQQVFIFGLEVVSGVSGWHLELVGGGRRSKQKHDADFLATHPTHSTAGLIRSLYGLLVAEGRLVPQHEGFCRVASGAIEGYLERARMDTSSEHWTTKHQMDRYDHIWGVFITAAGRRCRADIMLVPRDRWWWALVGWTGSKQYLRFMRQHAGNCRMLLNSHAMFRKTPQGGRLVPDEVPPLDSDGKEFWPPSWQESGKHSVESEEDLFALLRIPYRPPHERNCG